MVGSKFYLLFVAYVLFDCVLAASTEYEYFDDSWDCIGGTGLAILNSYKQDAYLKAWDPDNLPIKDPIGTCAMTVFSYESNWLKYSFDHGGEITDCGVTLEVYEEINDNGEPDATYRCYETLPTETKYTSGGYLTLKLKNPYPYSSDFNFSLRVQNAEDTSLSAGAITGIVIGSFVFVALVISIAVGVYCAKRGNRTVLNRPVVAQTQPLNTGYPMGQPVAYGAPYPGQYPPGQYQPPPAGNYPQPPPTGSYPQPAPAGDYPQPAPTGNYPQPAPAGNYPQPAPAGSNPQPAPTGNYPPSDNTAKATPTE